MISSMTGYAATTVDTPRGRMSLELRSVNGRFLDLQFRIPEDLRGYEPMLRERLSAALARGKVECRISLAASSVGGGQSRLDPQALEELATLSAEVRKAFPDAGTLRVADILRWPGVLADVPLDEESMRSQLDALCEAGLRELIASRQREGAKLADALRDRVREMRERVAEIAPFVPEAIAAYQERIAQRLRDALGSADDERVRAEVAVWATKADIDEEMTRLATHCDELERILERGGAAGKRLDFLAQELNREANTIASKASSQQVSDGALALKLLIEQVREQVQNIE